MVGWSLRTFAAMPEIAEVAIVTEDEWREPMRSLVSQIAPAGWAPQIVPGGATRQESVRNGLQAIASRVNAVFVHDGARPLVRADDVRRGMREVREGRGAVLAAQVVDTIKVVDPASMNVVRTLDRQSLWAAQTPQFAMVRDLMRAHTEAQRAGLDLTDDVALLERLGIDVAIVPSSTENFKVTHPGDIARAEPLLKERTQHAPQEEEVLLVEVFANDALTEAIERELVARGGTIDAVERDLPQGVAVRAFVPAERLRGFSQRFEAFGDGSATFTARFSHYAGRSERSMGETA